MIRYRVDIETLEEKISDYDDFKNYFNYYFDKFK